MKIPTPWLLSAAALLVPALAILVPATPSTASAPLPALLETEPDLDIQPPGDEDCLFVVEPLSGVATIYDTDPVHVPHLDVKPGECPNVFPVQADDDGGGGGGGGVANPARIVALRMSVLGNDFDVTQVDIGTLRLSLPPAQFATFGTPLIPPYDVTFADNGTPFLGVPCNCHALNGDGILDLKMKFDRDQVIDEFQLDTAPDGLDVKLRISARSPGGLGFRITDCVRISQTDG